MKNGWILGPLITKFSGNHQTTHFKITVKGVRNELQTNQTVFHSHINFAVLWIKVEWA